MLRTFMPKILRQWLYKFCRQKWREMTFGELLDKRSIWIVKLSKNINKEQHTAQLQELDKSLFQYIIDNFDEKERMKILQLMAQLAMSNRHQFELEDLVRSLDGEGGMQAAKAARKQNNIRVELKRKVDILFGEKFLEQKKYSGDK